MDVLLDGPPAGLLLLLRMGPRRSVAPLGKLLALELLQHRRRSSLSSCCSNVNDDDAADRSRADGLKDSVVNKNDGRDGVQ